MDVIKNPKILLMHIGSVEKPPTTAAGSPLVVRCKHFLTVTFLIPKERDRHDISTALQQLSYPMNIRDLYCFHYTAASEGLVQSEGWNLFPLEEEFKRQGVPNKLWIKSTINANYEICDTYPSVLYFPASATVPQLVASAKFRSKGRLPTLSYINKKNMAVICRCSQPLSGVGGRCVEDEQLLHCILRSNPNSRFMYIVDTRPRINAMAQKAAGKGFENENFYENIKFHFFGIENIHVMRSSLAKLLEASELKVPSMSAFLTALRSSGWLRHIRAVLEAATFVARAIEDGVSVLVHCSDGWDRTAQTCSLSCLLLDPHYRSIQGFQALIEKDWLAFGHKFIDRCGFVQGDPKEVAPIFTQFLDAVWQLCLQFPTAFEFNERFLLTLHDHVYSCQFGTFVGNCEKDRLDLRLSKDTYSLWNYISKHTCEFVNPLYEAGRWHVLKPQLIPQLIRYWRGMYNRFENGIHPREPLSDILLAAKDHSSSLEDHVQFLKEQLNKCDQGSTSPSIAKSVASTSSGASSVLDGPMTGGALCGSNDKQPTVVIEDELVAKLKLDAVDAALLNAVPTMVNSGHLAAEMSSLDNPMSARMRIIDAMETVAVDWKPLRNVAQCACSTPFDYFSKKFHCWSCGDVCCTRCIDKQIALPGHASCRPVPVCRLCYKELYRGPDEAMPAAALEA